MNAEDTSTHAYREGYAHGFRDHIVGPPDPERDAAFLVELKTGTERHACRIAKPEVPW